MLNFFWPAKGRFLRKGVASPLTVQLPMAVFSVCSCPILAGSALAFNYNSDYPVTDTDNSGFATLKDHSTGINATLSGSDRNVSFGMMAKRLTSPSNGEKDPPIANPEFFGITLLGISGGSIRICVPETGVEPGSII